MSEIILSSNYSVVNCANCSMPFAMLTTFKNERLSDHKTFYCPKGHANHYPGESECEKKEKIIKQLSSKLFNQDNLFKEKNEIIHRLELSKRALKAHLTIKKNKIEELSKHK